jgi:hypothetical protein
MAASPSTYEKREPFSLPKVTQNPSLSSLSKARMREPFGGKI